MRRQKRHTLGRLAAYSVAAGAAALGAASTANAALNVYDHRASSFHANVAYWGPLGRDGGDVGDQTLAVLNVKTGDFQYFQYENSSSRFDQDGFVDNNPIPEAAKTDDTVWFSHRDMDINIRFGLKVADGVMLETPTGGAGGQFDSGQGPVYAPQRIDPAAAAHDLYWANQTFDHDYLQVVDSSLTPDESWALPYPRDPDAGESPPHAVAVDGSLSYNDSSPTGYTGALVHGYGGGNWYGTGGDFGVTMYEQDVMIDDPESEDPEDLIPNPLNPNGIPRVDRAGRTLSLGFKLEETDGTHYGWVALHHDFDRNRIRNVLGWAYQTTPFMPAELTWVGDSGGVPGDFTGEGDVNAADIDILCDNMGLPYDPLYDLDNGTGTGTADGVVDDIDLIYHIEELVEWDNGVDSGEGTKQGDFNLDGVVNATDLAIMKGTFGASGVGYAGGNANCDDVVNATDLAILKGSFGFIAVPSPGGGVPEPATLTLLAMGAAGLAAKRRRRS